ncbi:hypothetical protein HGRIS_003310 [Hohenbuehelia grisea]|uniref:Agmatinase n=1 Tax=Hohenbuehelia grisea TaxID=104357 RepID=A0ABR3JGI8_9AGAR
MNILLQLALVSLAAGQTIHNAQQPITIEPPNASINVSDEPWSSKYGDQHDLSWTGLLTFSHLPYTRCLEDATKRFDFAVIGFPFDTTTSYRPGARFGPAGIRHGSRRQTGRSHSLAWGASPYEFGAAFMDCGDVPISAYDNAKAMDQMEAAYSTLIGRPVQGGTAGPLRQWTAPLAKDGKEHPRVITMGGDHTIVLPILRSLHKVYGPVSVIHFDSHLDTWDDKRRQGQQERITHGSYFAIAAEEGLLRNNSIHAGIRGKLSGLDDIEHDTTVGFQIISTDDLDDYGIDNIIEFIREHVGGGPVYLSLDIDVLDPSTAPATGTPEASGWTAREVKRILRGLSGLNFVGADLVEVAPAFDHADITSILAADLIVDFMTMMQLDAPPQPHVIKHFADKKFSR